MLFAQIVAAQSTEVLYGIQGFPFTGLARLDAATGNIKQGFNTQLPPGYLWEGIAFDGAQFLAPTIRGGAWPSFVEAVRPASGFSGPLQHVSGRYANMSMCVDPQSRILWGVGQSQVGITDTELWQFDPVTGLATSHGFLHGATTFATGITFAPNGTCYLTDAFGPRLLTLDINTRITTPVGDLAIATGSFFDITYSIQGEIWGSFLEAGPFPTQSGIWRFDPNTLAKQRVNSMNGPYLGLCFARYPTPTPLCSGKTNSLGCVPTIEYEGFPSASGIAGFHVRALDVINNQLGMLLIGVSGPGAVPFGGGTLCMAAPYYRTVARSAGGSPTGADCTGVWEFDLLQEIRRRESLGLPPAFSAGSVVNLQWIGRDPALGPPNPISLSGAIAVTLMP